MNWDFLFGKLTLDALPFYSPIAAGGAGVIVLGGIAVLAIVWRFKAFGYLWREWLTSTDHKKIGMMYVMPAWDEGGMPIRLVRLGALVVAGVIAYFGMLALLGFRLRDFSRRAVL